MKSGFGILTVALVVVSPTFEARAGEVPREPGLRGAGGQLLIDHQPHPFGGLFSDTDFVHLGAPFWQRVADDILLTEPPPGPITRIVWWGFYGGTFDKVPEPPPATETMRIRFYDSRPADGLPGTVLFEESFLNPSRMPTGRLIALGPAPPEYIFEVDLTAPFGLDADVPYWLEIVQFGNFGSKFRWEFSQTEANGQAVINPIGVEDWRPAQSISSDTAYQLWAIPEPASGALVVLVSCLLVRRRSGLGRECHREAQEYNRLIRFMPPNSHGDRSCPRIIGIIGTATVFVDVSALVR